MELAEHWFTLLEQHGVELAANMDQPLNLYVIAETSLKFELDYLAEVYAPLALFPEENMQDETPHLYPIKKNDADELLHELLGASIGEQGLCFIWSVEQPENLLVHLQNYTKAKDENQMLYWLRFWDVRVLPSFQKGLTEDEQQHFYQNIKAIAVEDYRNAKQIKLYKAPENTLSGKTGQNRGPMPMGRQLKATLMQGFQRYIQYQLANQLYMDYAKESLNSAQTESWVIQQSQQLLDWQVTNSEVHVNLIKTAWLENIDMQRIREQANIDHAQTTGLFSYSQQRLETALEQRQQGGIT